MSEHSHEAALRLSAVSVELAKNPVLRDVSLSVARGEWVTLAGPNGAGKSTLLRACAGLVAHAGDIELDGEPLVDLAARERAQRVSYLPQQPTLPPGMTVGEYVLLGRTPHLKPLGVESQRDLALCGDVIAQLDLAQLTDRELTRLSGGELQRCHLARALAQQAPVVLADELTTALDLGHEQQALELIDSFRRSASLTVVAAMHDLNAAAQYSDRIVLIDAGQVVAEGSPPDVLTAEVLRELYRANVRVTRSDGQLVVVPLRDTQPGGCNDVDVKPDRDETASTSP